MLAANRLSPGLLWERPASCWMRSLICRMKVDLPVPQSPSSAMDSGGSVLTAVAKCVDGVHVRGDVQSVFHAFLVAGTSANGADRAAT